MDEVLADDGCRLWTTASGAGRPLILCHGGPGLWDYLGDVAAMLDGSARVVRWDQRGAGRSEPRGPYTVARFVADLDAVRDRFGADRVDLLGHSWGASLALRYALAHPDRVDRLIYVSGTGIDSKTTWAPAYRHSLSERQRHIPQPQPGTPTGERESVIRQWSADYADPAAAMAHAERAATPWFDINYDCNAALGEESEAYLAGTDVAALCRELDLPVLIVDGDRDIRPRSAVDSLHRALPRVERVTVVGAGHLPWVEDPEAFRAAVTWFLNG